MSLQLPSDKQIVYLKLVKKFKKLKKCIIREFAEFIGKLNFATIALRYSPLYMKNFEVIKNQALERNNNNFDKYMQLPLCLQSDFDWWINNIQSSCNPIKDFDFAIEISSDASLTGWGAHCNNKSTHGFWSSEERHSHINILELKAAFFALR